MTPGEIKAFGEGVIDGVRVTLNQLDGQGAPNPAGAYQGPIPPELRNWIEYVRSQLLGGNEVSAVVDSVLGDRS